ncbi:MAG: 2-C-methyl-D-erythritol 4-phosphate cytidylyltransferase [Cytophagaceae bacterium]|nr:2-C-methyl-D-erythritol 4-phosphate cytidylyltransferase [Cytophagaceae bacterium]MDW8456925.1 2-C-methyl-D-erythritol 4-phosphate cytidylyltransferase [Cytophagaceae bacterium]
MKKYAIIVAGGMGLRMGGDQPKQFMLLNNLPILMHTIQKFFMVSADINLLVVLPEAHKTTWLELVKKYSFNIAHTVVNGGKERFHSVKNALEHIANEEEALVAIHDAVRPFISTKVIENSFAVAEKFGSAVTCVPLKDSMRKIEGESNYAVDRKDYVCIQTPQTFLLSVLKNSYSVNWNEKFTDDASVIEHAGFPIHLIAGHYSNIKITTPEDLLIGEVLCSVT